MCVCVKAIYLNGKFKDIFRVYLFFTVLPDCDFDVHGLNLT